MCSTMSARAVKQVEANTAPGWPGENSLLPSPVLGDAEKTLDLSLLLNIPISAS